MSRTTKGAKYSADDFELVKENKKDPKKTTVRRVNITNEFEIGDIEKQLAHLDKLETEVASQQKVCDAYMKNVRDNYGKVIDQLSEEEMHAVHMYYENLTLGRDSKNKLKEIRKQKKDYKEISDLIHTKFGFVKTQ